MDRKPRRWITCALLPLVFLLGSAVADNKEGYYGKYIGKLSQLHHGVSGDVFAVDARTLHLRNFNYDGEGPAAYFYAGNSKAPGANGFRLRDERGTTNVLPRYRNKHLTITLPEGKTLQNVRWFSVWCDEFSVNFGDVKIPKNLDFPKPQKIGGLAGVHGVSSEPIVVVDAQTLLVPGFSYDGEAPDAKFWVGRGFKPSPQGIRIPDENGKELPLRRYDRKTIVLTLPGDLTVFDVGHFGVWCEAFTVDFGHVQIPRGLNVPPSLKMLGVSPQSKLNCEVLWDDFAYEVRWAVAGDSIVLQLVARLENDEYMSFGLSGDKSRSRMVGGDVAVAWVDKESLKGYAKDYYLDAKSQCSGGRGSCPDENVLEGTDSVRLLNAALVNGYSIVTFQRSLKAQDELDKHVFTNGSQPVVWAIGPLNSRKEVSYHSLTNRGDVFIDFGRPPKWNCPTPEAVSEEAEPQEAAGGHDRDLPDARPTAVQVQDLGRRDSRPKSRVPASPPAPAPAPKAGAWEIPPIKCHEPEDGVFYAQMGPTGGKHGYSAITGHVGWGISWYINGLLIPEINVVRGRTYTFIVEGGLDPETPARYHPFYITDDPVGGYQYKTPQERANVQIFAGAVQNKRGEVRPTGVGRLCNWTPDPNQPPADEFASFGAYQRTLRLECDPGNPGIIQWTVEKDTPDTVYYQCYTHRYLGWKINVHDRCEGEAASEPAPSFAAPPPQDFEASESIDHETRVKPDPEFLKNHSAKNGTVPGPNRLGAAAAAARRPGSHHGKPSDAEFRVKAPPPGHREPPRTSGVQRFPAGFLEGNRLVEIPRAPATPSYMVREEPPEETDHQGFHGFQGVPAYFPPQGPQQHRQRPAGDQAARVPGSTKVVDAFRREAPEHFHVSIANPEEKSKRPSQRPAHHGKPAGRIPAAARNPFDAAGHRPRKPNPPHALTLQQRPFPPGAFRPPPLSRKPQPRPPSAGPHRHRPEVGASGEDFDARESQATLRVRLPAGHRDPFGGPAAGKRSPPQSLPFALDGGFDPQSVQVEGGFKPILNARFAPEAQERIDPEVGDDDVGTADSPPDRPAEREVGDKERELFGNPKPQSFEPIFVPSFPDDGGKKHREKQKKPSATPKSGDPPLRVSDAPKKGRVHSKTGPGSEGSRAGNILEVMEMRGAGGDPVQDEVAMADERRDFYLPPRADRFLSYDGKVVEAVEAPTLPENGSPADVSKLPQFVPFKGVTPPLALPVDARNLPQLRNSKLAREDILPPSGTPPKGAAEVSLGSRGGSPQERTRRSPDHVPGHAGHDHHDHRDHDHHPRGPNGGSSLRSSLFPVVLASFALTCLRGRLAL